MNINRNIKRFNDWLDLDSEEKFGFGFGTFILSLCLFILFNLFISWQIVFPIVITLWLYVVYSVVFGPSISKWLKEIIIFENNNWTDSSLNVSKDICDFLNIRTKGKEHPLKTKVLNAAEELGLSLEYHNNKYKNIEKYDAIILKDVKKFKSLLKEINTLFKNTEQSVLSSKFNELKAEADAYIETEKLLNYSDNLFEPYKNNYERE